jgi:hypothetical protein
MAIKIRKKFARRAEVVKFLFNLIGFKDKPSGLRSKSSLKTVN